uniref:EGF-like domain-containing protein n=1 Tax=Trichuris muris TaxID=70415 RepID=A0A5S6QJK0_TRIMR
MHCVEISSNSLVWTLSGRHLIIHSTSVSKHATDYNDILIDLSLAERNCPYEASSKIAGFQLNSKEKSIKCVTVYKRNEKTIDDADAFCEEAFGNSSKRLDRIDDASAIKIANDDAGSVKLVLLEHSRAAACQVYENGEVRNKTPCSDVWNRFACVHEPIELCEIVGSCAFNMNTSVCKFTFTRFRWSRAHADLRPCEELKDCWCDPCESTAWSGWHSDSDTREIIRKVIDKCENEGTLNRKKTMCSCKTGFTGLTCENKPLGGISFVLLVVVLCVASFSILILVFVIRCCKIRRKDKFQESFSQCRSTYWEPRGNSRATASARTRRSSPKRKESSRSKKDAQCSPSAKRRQVEQPSAPALQDYEVPKVH